MTTIQKTALLASGFFSLCLIHTPKIIFAGDYLNSSHGNSGTGVDRSTIDPKFSSYSVGNCAHCHEQHSSIEGTEPTPVNNEASPVLRFTPEEALCETCHDGTPVSPNIAIQFDKTYGHPTDDIADRHFMSIKEIGQNGSYFRNPNRHVECSDCHEPHRINYLPTTPFNSSTHNFITGNPANNNTVSGVLTGVWGVEPAVESSIWLVPPSSYTELTESTKEYQICLKCHSNFAFQTGNGISPYIGPSGVPSTDQSMEFSVNRYGVHPVRNGLNNQTGSYSPKTLNTQRLKSPWNSAANLGNQTMYCSDCHGADDESAGGAVGPHGSNRLNLLKGTNNSYWPFRPDGEYWTLNDVDNKNYPSRYSAAQNQLLCLKCHPIWNTGADAFYNMTHDEHGDRDYEGNPWRSAYPQGTGYLCISCHSPIPHGARSRLIGYETDPAPYRVNGKTHSSGTTYFPLILGFKKATDVQGQNYNKDNCWANGTACGNGRHPDESGQVGGYDQ